MVCTISPCISCFCSLILFFVTKFHFPSSEDEPPLCDILIHCDVDGPPVVLLGCKSTRVLCRNFFSHRGDSNGPSATPSSALRHMSWFSFEVFHYCLVQSGFATTQCSRRSSPPRQPLPKHKPLHRYIH